MAMDWNLLTPLANAPLNALAAFEHGQAQRKQRDGQNAMTAYAQNPGDMGSLNALAAHDPKFVVEQKQQMAAQQQAGQDRQLIGDALANPDPQAREMARQRLAYTNHEFYQKLGAEQKAVTDNTMKVIGQTAFQILQMPEDQQGPALQRALQGLSAQGVDVSKIDLSQGPKQTLLSALAMTGQLNDWEKFSQPNYTPVGEGGLAGFQFGQPIQQGGQAQNFGATVQPGQVEDGYRFKGGNPADQNAWEPVGQGGQTPASGGFQPRGISGETVTSTYRTPAHNREVGGVSNSFHTRKGPDGKPLARDSVPPRGVTMAAYHAQLKRQNPNLDVINEGDHIHMEPKG